MDSGKLDAMKCPSCASEVPDDRPECPSCGTPVSGQRDERVEELLGRYVEQRVVDGSTADAKELCRDCPELLETLQAHIRDYEELHQMLAPPGHLKPGGTLLHYRIVEKIGAGGMGEVYLAEDTKLERRVALKVLSPKTAGDPQRLRRFLREARLEAGLNHSNIVTVHSIEEAEGLAFLTMEVVKGKTLKELIPAEGLEPQRVLEIATQLADALVAAHDRGIMHRDLKPANVMVTEDGQAAPGRVKVLDFGLAKLRQPPGGGAEADSTHTLTTGGKILGTLPYMSPEQVQGSDVDLRTDIFSFGVVLYEMATGRRPFRGESMADLISTILRDTPAPVTEVNPRLPYPLGGIVQRCLEKDPEKRYASSREMRDELAELRSEIASQSGSRTAVSAVFAHPRRRARYAAGGLLAVLLLAAAYAGIVKRSERAAREPPDGEELTKPSVAVLYFENLSSDPELEWLHTGITDMLVTDLSQSPELEVLSTSRLHQILKDLDILGEPRLSFDLVQGVAERAAVEVVVRGSYARIGNVFRIDATLEGTAEGAILKSKRVEGRGEESLFAMVDELSAAIRNNFEVTPRPEVPATIEAVTTSSLQAWRLYSEALVLFEESKPGEAIARLEKAVDLDPTFALAFVSLGVIHKNLAHTAQAREYTQRAVELAERLPLNQRLTIEATHYSTRWATLGRAVEAFQEVLRFHPDRMVPRNNLAKRYSELERYEEAIREFRTLIDSGSSYWGDYTGIANAYAGLGRFETGYQILSEFTKRHPDNWMLQFFLGWQLTEWGKLDEALAQFERAATLRPDHYYFPYGRWRTQVLREDWRQAELEAAKILAFDDSFAYWRGAVSQARNLTYRGRTKEALLRFDVATRADSDFRALAHCWKAELLLQRGEAALGLAEAELAQELARDDWPELKGLFLAALARQRLGQPSQARRAEEELRQRAAEHPNVVEERQLHHLAGLLALAEGDAEGAVIALKRAESLLPPQGVEVHWHVFPDHVPIWYALGSAELAAGRLDEALGWLRNAVTSGAEHLESPVPYVRSFYFLGRIHQQRGEAAEARRYFERFLELWQDGDLDRERLQEARAYVWPTGKT